MNQRDNNIFSIMKILNKKGICLDLELTSKKEMCLGLGLTSENLCFEFEQNTKMIFTLIYSKGESKHAHGKHDFRKPKNEQRKACELKSLKLIFSKRK